MDIERLRAKLAEYRKQREQFLTQAQQQVAALDGAVQAMEQLIQEAERDAADEALLGLDDEYPSEGHEEEDCGGA